MTSTALFVLTLAITSQSVAQTPRQGQDFGGQFVTMRDGLEHFPLATSFGGGGISAAPTAFTGPAEFEWPPNNLRGQQSLIFIQLVDLSALPVGGVNGVVNATRALRIRTGSPQAINQLFPGASLQFGGDAEGNDPFLPLEPIPGAPARVSAELFISTLDELYTFEAGALFRGDLNGRLLWGGECAGGFGDCNDLGLPTGPIPTIYSLAPSDEFPEGRYTPARYCMDAQGDVIPGCTPPPGANAGDLVATPIANWARFVFETTADGRARFLLDPLDGSGESVVYENTLLASAYLDSVAWSTTFAERDAFMLVDNIEASGPVYQLPKPIPLACPYADDLEWLNTGPLMAQSPVRWPSAPTADADVVLDPVAGGKVIEQINDVQPDNYYRREFSTLLPPSNADEHNDLVVSVDVRWVGATPRGFALYGDDQLAARVYLGQYAEDTPLFSTNLFVQINSRYRPIDRTTNDDPLDNYAIPGVDIVNTGAYFNNMGVYTTLTMRLSANGALRVFIGDQRVYAGPSGFATFIDRFDFESENRLIGHSALLRIDNVTTVCGAPSCATDFDFDNATSMSDLQAVLVNFAQPRPGPSLPRQLFREGDANADGEVNFADLNAVLAAFGTSCD